MHVNAGEKVLPQLDGGIDYEVQVRCGTILHHES